MTYGNVTYRAPPSETRVACFGAVSDDFFFSGDERSDPLATDERFLAPSLTTRAFSSSSSHDDDDDENDDWFSGAFRGATRNATSSMCALRGAKIVDAPKKTGRRVQLEKKKEKENEGGAFDYAAFFAAGDGFVAVRFAMKRRPRRDDTKTTSIGDVSEPHGWVPVALASGQRFETRTALSVFHRDWLPFPGGVLRAETEKE